MNRQLNWMVAAMWVGVLLSAIAVVSVSHHCRALYADLAKLERDANQLQVEWGQLLLEKAALASLGGIEHIAQSRLGMQAPEPADVVVVRP